MSILNVEHLTHGFGDRAIFADVSFRLLKGEHIGLVGANGEGKSTFLNIVTGKLMPDEGKIEWDQEGTTIQYLKPDTSSYFTSSAYEKEMTKELAKYKGRETIQITTENYMEVMELIYLYPNDFVGKKVTYTGFVYNDPQTKGYQFIFRFGIIHCIADSGVYGLATTGSDQTFKDNTWVTVTGTITVNYYQNLKQSLPILNLTEIKEVSQPDNPYVYRVF